ncbi:DNA-directed RNA polymerase subunit beta [Halobacillus kuroshimensis]|uniref:DNA-directed RNA polymerase subunit beta n=1 Tax=Halobacillus kuroshimensis TaxID=302481 RepID=A0ABS3DUJ7_9BACI|nr:MULTISPECIES: DNA-directed RNA polymerase subunit beta [Halobacillus]MBN8235019.1 DNA-directed RNA polymerase subunit beta [Halobacillus kuroshimensis]
MATDPKSKGKKLNKKQEKENKRRETDKKAGAQADKKEKNLQGRRRILPIWLRIILVVLFSAAALIIGLMVGYGVLGDGNPMDALKLDTWKHILDIVMKTE